MDSHGGGINLLKDFMVPSIEVSTELLSIDITILAVLHWYFSWLFARFMGQESTSHTPRSILYVFHFSFQLDLGNLK
jgi:hypothetical protein